MASSSKMSTYLQPLSNKASARCTATMCDWAHPNTHHALRVPFVRIVCNLALSRIRPEARGPVLEVQDRCSTPLRRCSREFVACKAAPSTAFTKVGLQVRVWQIFLMCVFRGPCRGRFSTNVGTSRSRTIAPCKEVTAGATAACGHMAIARS